jgi:hypothetical protein
MRRPVENEREISLISSSHFFSREGRRQAGRLVVAFLPERIHPTFQLLRNPRHLYHVTFSSNSHISGLSYNSSLYLHLGILGLLGIISVDPIAGRNVIGEISRRIHVICMAMYFTPTRQPATSHSKLQPLDAVPLKVQRDTWPTGRSIGPLKVALKDGGEVVQHGNR